MFKFLQTHKKHVAAVFSAILMLAWAIPGKGNGAGGRSDHEVGRVADRVLHQSDFENARSELDVIRKDLRETTTDRYGQEVVIPITARLLRNQEAAAQLQQRPDVFAVLKADALAAGVRVDSGMVGQAMQYYAGPATDPDEEALARQAVTDVLLIRERYNQWRSALRVSTPMVDYAMALMAQKPSFDVVQLRADDYAPRVPAPTTQQVQTQFDTYKDVLAGHPVADSNPFGFGYKYPVRSKLQWIKVRRSEIEKTVIARKSDYDWDVAARRYYTTHESDFADPKTPGAIKPYSTVVAEAVAKVRKDPTDELAKQVAIFLGNTLDGEWRAHDESVRGKLAPTTGPTSFTDIAHFTAAANAVQQNPSLSVFAYPGETAYLSEDELLNDASIGTLPGQSAKEYPLVPTIRDLVAAWHKSADPDAAAAMSALMRPSPVMTTPSGDLIVVRVISVLPSVVPPSLDAVRPQVESDLRKKAGYDLARQDADRLAADAKLGTMLAVANQEHRVVTPIDKVRRQVIEQYLFIDDPLKPFDPPSVQWRDDFLEQAFKAVMRITADDPRPAVVITKPADGRVFVAQVKSVVADWDKETFYHTMIQGRGMVVTELDRATGFSDAYFDPKTVFDRVGYKSNSPPKP